MAAVQIRNTPGDRLAIAAGRALAIGLHPFAAWRSRPRTRAAMVVGYFVASYALVLGGLLLF
jgi:hypothetical protein